ncbi:hypothetical protein LTR05_000823 [Lithohypha guttulata]|uniref:gamma-glutamylcyclotransferase n=1 Tax=Lithohypha guttulata TaxID=1690604 RepID=A0AAN7YJP4_9EURO|nr:hypothetical protein LTR05_000823 [Lithohypha guttulata]
MDSRESYHRGESSLPAAVAVSSIAETVEPILPAKSSRQKKLQHDLRATSKTSLERRQRSRNDQAFDSIQVTALASTAEQDDETVLYLGYGSNLAAETFLGKRGIRPLSQINIVAPSIALTFDLPGIPYSEPCFANSRYRDAPSDGEEKPRPPYHKNAWKKGLVGVVYEVTKQDYAHIIATEGGGAGYHDVVVDCYALDDDPNLLVPAQPSGTPFKAHTLYAHREQSLRPNPDYAQPSARYLKLITDGAGEHNLPMEYRHFLSNIRTYHTTTSKQQIGSFIFLAVWGPIFAFFFGSAKMFLDKHGRYPDWMVDYLAAMFTACWASYDRFFLKLFGDGERTIGDDLDGVDEDSPTGVDLEKVPLLATEASKIESYV